MRKVILSRPRGGLNDTLCQLERCFQYALKYDRLFVPDTRLSGLGLDFHRVFEPVEQNLAIRTKPLHYLESKFSKKPSIFPPELTGKFSNYVSYLDSVTRAYHEMESGVHLALGLRVGRDEDIVVHESEGGGIASQCFLTRVTLAAPVRGFALERWERLPETYVAAHVRHTDISSDYKPFLKSVRKRVGDSHLFLATDSREVINYAKQLFGADRLLLTYSADELGHEPIHLKNQASYEDRLARCGELFADLLALAGATDFYYTNLYRSARLSGLTRLARFFALNPEVRSQFFGLHGDVPQKEARIHPISRMDRRVVEALRWRREAHCHRPKMCE